MQLEDSMLKLKTFEAVFITILILSGISFSIIRLEMVPHIPIILSIIFLLIFGLIKGVSIERLEAGIVEGAKSGLGAIMIFFFIGMLISSWIASGTIPTIVYFTSEMITGQFYFAIVFVITAIIGLSIGSSLTTAATIGIIFISISQSLELSLPITAGAIISGAFFGDKMSPLSDTTNLASTIVKVDLFEHIRNMAWTTVPAFIFTFIFFILLSPKDAQIDASTLEIMNTVLMELDFIHLWALIPFLILVFLALKKVSAIITLSASIVSAMIIAFCTQTHLGTKNILSTLYFGYVSNSGNEKIDTLLTRGGMESMLFSVSLVILSLSMGGLLFKLGILPALLSSIQRFLRKASIIICSAAATAIGINFLLGEQYLSILLTGNTFHELFQKAGLESKNLSRVLEDAGTVINPLVPWGVSGIFLTNVLGVTTVDYFPFTFFCLFSPLLTVLFGLTGFTISKKDVLPSITSSNI
ncbi:Na+/H+ antiporter NhaC [Bacillus sp. CGMCC 1.16607]|uniref:Na+/H+ antiporter NhaC n=1 Tax=Bacillus sp. CGMCC 1.16607 TaxID=3351842 RepID=UPI0036284D2F